MINRLPQKAAVGWGILVIAIAAMLCMTSTALAVQTNQYDALSACPTDAPVLNDPASEFAACAAGVAHGGVLKIGALAIPLSRMGVQFGAIGWEGKDPECPPPPGFCFGRAPGTTTIESAPSLVNIKPPKGSKGKGASVKVTIESAGDIRAVSPGFLFEIPVPLFKLPIKLHVEAPGLGRRCYVGSDDEPVFLTPFVTGPPASGGSSGDPNGFKVEVITFTSMPLVDQAIAIPAADGCSPSHRQLSHGRHHRTRHHSPSPEDRLVNDLIGLPSPPGNNEVVLPSTDLTIAAAEFDGTPPDGGAELQAAFDAAK